MLMVVLWLEQKREAPPGEKPEPVRTHLRNMIIVPEMIGSIIGVYNGKTFNQVEIKPEMIGHYLAEFSISYKPVKHGRPGIGATHSSRFIPLKWRFCTCPEIAFPLFCCSNDLWPRLLINRFLTFYFVSYVLFIYIRSSYYVIIILVSSTFSSEFSYLSLKRISD